MFFLFFFFWKSDKLGSGCGSAHPSAQPSNYSTITQTTQVKESTGTDGGSSAEVCVSAHTNQRSVVRKEGVGGQNVLGSSLTG